MPFSKSRRAPARRPARRPTRKPTRKPTGSRRNTVKSKGHVVGSTTATVQRGYLPFGRTFYAKLPYVENYAIAVVGTTGLSTVNLTYRANDVFDPRFDLGGHQPLQYDALAAAYERVWVHGCKVTLTFSNPEHDGMWVGYRVRAGTNIVATNGQTLDYIQEMRESAISPLNNTGSQKKVYTFYVPNAKVFGITKAQYANLDYSHTTATSPIPQVFIEPYAVHTIFDQTSSVRVNIKMTYYCQFTNPVTQEQS